MLQNPDFEQNFWSKTAEGICEKGQDSIRLLKRLDYCDRSYHDNLNYFDLLGSICDYLILNECS